MSNAFAATAGLVAAITLIPVSAHAEVVAEWRMDEKAGATTMVDSQSRGGLNHGKVVGVRTGVAGLVSGLAYEFAESAARVEVADTSALDPGAASIVLSATVRIPQHTMQDDSYDLVRKGVASTPGGYWKMEVNRRDSDPSVGRLRCVFKGVLPDGSKSQVMRLALPDIVDGRVHRLQCARVGTSVQAVVDGQVFKSTKATGVIANSSPVLVGAKTAGDDVLRGTLDHVTVDIG